MKQIVKLPDTGLTACYDADGEEIPRPKPGDNLYGQNGCFTAHPMSFQKLDTNGRELPDAATWPDGLRTVLDRNTGLVWEVKSPDTGDVNYADDRYAWQEAQDVYTARLNDATYGGYTDWRIPNKDELRTILNYGQTNPAVDTWYFPHCKIDFYWTCMTYEMQPYFGWGLFFGLGSGIAYGKTNARHVRAVRGGYDAGFGKPDPARFEDNGDGTVTDTMTGLMWQQGENERMNWFDALKACRKMNLAGHTDWRMPNIKELNTILNINYTDGWWYYKDVFPAAGLKPPLLHYFSSTPHEQYYAWVTNFCFGYDGYYANKKATLLFRAVRNSEPVEPEQTVFRFPATGQSECTDDEGNVIGMPEPGEPFHGQDGCYTGNALSFSKLREAGGLLADDAVWDDGLRMVQDNNTGLMWESKSPNAMDINFMGNKMDFADAQAYIEALNSARYGGFSDWRLPNREEFRSIVDYGGTSPAVNTRYFPNCLPIFYWSKDVYGADPKLIWGLYFGYGCSICYLNTVPYSVRAVRGGYNPAFGDTSARAFKDNKDGTVSDLNTSLMWRRDEGPELNWQEALAYCETLDLGGHQDWRLPNMKEIATLIDPSFRNGAWFDKEVFPDVKTKPLGFYWASTTYGSSFGWGVNFQFGYDGYYAGKKHGAYPFRPVRNS